MSYPADTGEVLNDVEAREQADIELMTKGWAIEDQT